ncbi:MAG TPA: hypothetical protein VHE35_34450 [Kofleriaceae bacterium]|nr:hypothetical protein [Kofleriaceae bacterium]
MRTTISIILLAACGAALVACADADPSTGDTTAAPAATAARTTPPDLCDEESHEPVPRPGGSCTFEVSLDSITNVTGQGISEGAMEVNVVASSDAHSKGWPGALPAVHAQFIPGSTVPVGKGYVLATYTVAPGSQQQAKVCADFTEVDNGGTNGGDDTGRACTNVTMTATAAGPGRVLCTATPSAPTVETELCGDNQCNGRFAANFDVMVQDADLDGTANEDDFTPDVCDEEEKGQKGRASLIYFHMGNGPMETFFQAFGTDLSKAMTGYDYKVVILDPTYAGPFLVNAPALAQADLILDPYEDNLYAAMREITRRGYDMDLWIWSHGAQFSRDGGHTFHTEIMSEDDGECWDPHGHEVCGNGLDDDQDGVVDEAACIVKPPGPPDEICWNALDDDADGIVDEADGIWDTEIAQNLTPTRIGTPLVPIRMTYSIACFNEGMNWAWSQVGAYVTSGTIGVDFYPVFYGGFADAWNASSSYSAAVVASDRPGDRSLVNTYVDAQAVPWDCDDITLPNHDEELLSVRDRNACAHDFFVNDGGTDDAVYDLGHSYDDTVSGQANMDAQSARVIDGDGAIHKFLPATLTW